MVLISSLQERSSEKESDAGSSSSRRRGPRFPHLQGPFWLRVAEGIEDLDRGVYII